jgi:hypothetical protein
MLLPPVELYASEGLPYLRLQEFAHVTRPPQAHSAPERHRAAGSVRAAHAEVPSLLEGCVTHVGTFKGVAAPILHLLGCSRHSISNTERPCKVSCFMRE